MDKLQLAAGLLDEMIVHANACYPEEACGFLAGTGSLASRFYPIKNVLQSIVAFEMEPQQQIEALIDIEDDGLSLVAIFHSHPDGPSRPSSTDIVQACYPDSAQVIISLVNRANPESRAFIIRSGTVREIPLIPVD